MSVRFKVETADVKAALRDKPRAVRKGVLDGMRGIGKDWERHMKERFKPGGKGNRGGRDIRARTGALRRSVRFKLLKGSGELFLMVGGQNAPHAGIQEYGGVITPKRGKFLTVPLDNALTASGAISGRARIRPIGGGKFATDMGPTFIYRSKRGNLLIGVKRNNRKRVDLKRDTLYVLKRRVRIQPRLGAWDAARLDGARGPAIRRRLFSSVQRALKEAN